MKRDNLVFDIIKKEYNRQLSGIELIASENFVSEQVLEAMGSVMTNKYAEGYPGKRYYGGCQFVDQTEQLAIDRIKEIYGVITSYSIHYTKLYERLNRQSLLALPKEESWKIRRNNFV